MSTPARKKEKRSALLQEQSRVNRHLKELTPHKSSEFREYVPKNTYRRETPNYPSLNSGACVAPKPDTKVYTGTLVKGIGQLHKSNAVPVLDADYAKDIATMRRN